MSIKISLKSRTLYLYNHKEDGKHT